MAETLGISPRTVRMHCAQYVRGLVSRADTRSRTPTGWPSERTRSPAWMCQSADQARCSSKRRY